MNLHENLTDRMTQWERLGHPALLDRFVLRNGKPYTGRKRIGRKKAAKQCFMNAAHAVFQNPDWTYVEGFVTIPEMAWPIHHAWVTTDGTDAMDPTLDTAGREYYGVAFDTTTLRRELVKNKVYGLLDTGVFNTDLMFKVDPGLEQVLETMINKERKQA